MMVFESGGDASRVRVAEHTRDEKLAIVTISLYMEYHNSFDNNYKKNYFRCVKRFQQLASECEEAPHRSA